MRTSLNCFRAALAAIIICFHDSHQIWFLLSIQAFLCVCFFNTIPVVVYCRILPVRTDFVRWGRYRAECPMVERYILHKTIKLQWYGNCFLFLLYCQFFFILVWMRIYSIMVLRCCTWIKRKIWESVHFLQHGLLVVSVH